jgi:hypothetical protein
VIGSTDRPVILVVDDSDCRSLVAVHFSGFCSFSIIRTVTPEVVPSLQFTGTVEVFGSVISDIDDPQMGGTFSVVYSPSVLESFSSDTGGGLNFTMVQIPGSWRDF